MFACVPVMKCQPLAVSGCPYVFTYSRFLAAARSVPLGGIDADHDDVEILAGTEVHHLSALARPFSSSLHSIGQR